MWFCACTTACHSISFPIGKRNFAVRLMQQTSVADALKLHWITALRWRSLENCCRPWRHIKGLPAFTENLPASRCVAGLMTLRFTNPDKKRTEPFNANVTPVVPGPTTGYTVGMKTAVSIPDSLFSAAERLARRTGKSRSRVFSEALREYLARHAPDELTQAMNQACADIGEKKDRFVSVAARRILERTEW